MKKDNVVTKNESDKIWDEIKNLSINMFALPNQVVNQYCSPINIEPSKLYLLVNATSVLPALEAAMGNRFKVELMGKYVVVSRN